MTIAVEEIRMIADVLPLQVGPLCD